jgi:hypothetical protein
MITTAEEIERTSKRQCTHALTMNINTDDDDDDDAETEASHQLIELAIASSSSSLSGKDENEANNCDYRLSQMLQYETLATLLSLVPQPERTKSRTGYLFGHSSHLILGSHDVYAGTEFWRNDVITEIGGTVTSIAQYTERMHATGLVVGISPGFIIHDARLPTSADYKNEQSVASAIHVSHEKSECNVGVKIKYELLGLVRHSPTGLYHMERAYIYALVDIARGTRLVLHSNYLFKK